MGSDHQDVSHFASSPIPRNGSYYIRRGCWILLPTFSVTRATASSFVLLLHYVYGKLIRTIQRFQHDPPRADKCPQSLLDGALLLSDRIEMLRRLPKGGRVMECGVDEGKFSRHIVEVCCPDELILADTWGSQRFSSAKLDQIETVFEKELLAGSVRIERALSVDALSRVADESLAWVYLDTDHTYSTTKRELELAKQKVIPGGYICGHDYTVGSWESYTRYGVVEAVNEFCVEHGWRFAMLTHEPRRHLSFALRSTSQGEQAESSKAG